MTSTKYKRAGPWDDEPESLAFDAHGFRCQLFRNNMGAWCGYVGLPDTHPLFRCEYSYHSPALQEACDARLKQPIGDWEHRSFAVKLLPLGGEMKASPEMVFSVHGGITYSSLGLREVDEAKQLWWFGFDCGHAGDLSPDLTVHSDEVYRDMAYARNETECLAGQLATLQPLAIENANAP